MDRETIYGRVVAIATVLGDRVFESGTRSIASEFLSEVGKNPEKYVTALHHKLMERAYKFGHEEMVLFDLMSDQIAQLNLEDFNSQPLEGKYLHHYSIQKRALEIVGYKEAYKILEWDYEKNRSMLSTYLKRAEKKGWPADSVPQPIQTLASGPIWYRYQIEEYKNSRSY